MVQSLCSYISVICYFIVDRNKSATSEIYVIIDMNKYASPESVDLFDAFN